jgi:hypothetical protein
MKLEHTASFLPPRDTLSLRLTCRALHNSTLAPFAKANFTDRSFLLCQPYSLSILEEVSRHPFFTRRFKHIRLLATGWKRPSSPKPRRRKKAASKSTRQQADDRPEVSEHCQPVNLYKSPRDIIHHLAQILLNFKAAGHNPGIIVLNTDHKPTVESIYPRGVRRVLQQPSYPPTSFKSDFLDSDWGNEPLRAVFSATIQAEYPVPWLELTCSRCFGSRSLRLEIFYWAFPKLRWETLEVLHLVVSEDNDRDNVRWFRAALMSAPKLRELYLAFDKSFGREVSFHRPEVFPMLCREHIETRMLLPMLQSLHIINQDIAPVLLLRFLSQRKSTLLKVSLEDIRDEGRQHPEIVDLIWRAVDAASRNAGVVDQSRRFGLWMKDCYKNEGLVKCL